MTEEEYFRKNYPDSCYGDKLLSPHWDFFQEGVEFGERQSEKQIQIDAEQIRALQKQNGELTDKVTELEAQIEKMKCCGNCRFSESDSLNGTFCHREGCYVVASAKCKLWEM